MKNITDFLIFDSFRYGKEWNSQWNENQYKVEINQIDENPFYIPFGDKTKQWELTIVPQYRDLDGDEPTKEWHDDDRQTIRFKMSAYMKPTIEVFSKHIYDELNAILKAIGVTDEDYVWNVREKILTPIADGFEPQEVFNFMQNIHKDYTKTQDFLNAFDDFHHRMRQSLKFGMYLLEGNKAMFSMSYEYPIGEHLLAFLEIGKFTDHYE